MTDLFGEFLRAVDNVHYNAGLEGYKKCFMAVCVVCVCQRPLRFGTEGIISNKQSQGTEINLILIKLPHILFDLSSIGADN